MRIKNAISFTAAAVFGLAATPAPAQTVGGLTFHGFVGQGYLNSTDNNWLAVPTEDGSFAFTEAALNFNVEPIPRLRIGAQFFAQDLGATGNSRVILDWAVGDYRFNDAIGVRAGKVKMPVGLYNIVRDTPMARVEIVMPTGIYPLSQRDFVNAVQGFDVYGTIGLGEGGAVDYEAWVGTLDVDESHFVLQSAEEGARALLPALGLEQGDVLVDNPQVDIKYVVGGTIDWRTPVTGLRLKASINNSDIDGVYASTYTGFQSAGPVSIPVSFTTRTSTSFQQDYSVIASAEYRRGGLRLAGEYHVVKANVEAVISGLPVSVPPVTTVQEEESWYVQAAYRFNPTWEISGYYSEYYPDKNDKDGTGLVLQGRPAYGAWLKQWNAVARVDVNTHWLLKVEIDVFDGAATVSPVDNPDGIEQDWALFALQTVVHF